MQNNERVYEMQCNLLPNLFDLLKCWAYFALSSLCDRAAQHRITYIQPFTATTFKNLLLVSTLFFFIHSLCCETLSLSTACQPATAAVLLEGIPGNFSTYTYAVEYTHKYSWFTSVHFDKMKTSEKKCWWFGCKSYSYCCCTDKIFFSATFQATASNIANGLFNIISWQWNPI